MDGLADNQTYYKAYFYEGPVVGLQLTVSHRDGVEKVVHPLEYAALCRILADRCEEHYNQCPGAWDVGEE